MSGDATSLGVVDLDGCLWSKLGLLDVEEVDIVRTNVNDGKEE